MQPELSREEVLTRQLARAREEIVVLERLIEDKTRSLFMAQEELEETADFLSWVLDTLQSAVLVTDADGTVTRANQAAVRLFGVEREGLLVGRDVSGSFLVPGTSEALPLAFMVGEHHELRFAHGGTEEKYLLCAASDLRESDGLSGYVIVAADISYNKRLEMDLRHAQKLESVGQLAAGIAHEINTPIQFIGDSLTFLLEAFEDDQKVRALVDRLREAARAGTVATDILDEIDRTEDEIDAAFLHEEVPAALNRALNGVARVAKIVRAMKEFAHPGSEELLPVDLNRAVETTLTVAKGEMKGIAHIEMDFGDLPTVLCYEGDINQVVLNVVVNAAHAVQERLQKSPEPGRIRVSTRMDEGMAVIDIEDNGTGIPENVRERIFDPFFTTKDVGRGTGQGLALAHKVITERHRGEIRIQTEVGRGTTFSIRIPASPEVKRVAA